MIRYIAIATKESDRVKYGIAVMSGRECRDKLDDITTTLEEVIHLAALLQDNGVSSLHFRDVVEDYLADCRSLE